MKKQEKRIAEYQKKYDLLNDKVNVLKEQVEELNSSKELLDDLIEYYYNDWLTDREEVESDYLIMCEDPIYDLITDYYELIDELSKSIDSIKDSLKD